MQRCFVGNDLHSVSGGHSAVVPAAVISDADILNGIGAGRCAGDERPLRTAIAVDVPLIPKFLAGRRHSERCRLANCCIMVDGVLGDLQSAGIQISEHTLQGTQGFCNIAAHAVLQDL